jgi:hypothetical protein
MIIFKLTNIIFFAGDNFRTMWHADVWHEELENKGLAEPAILIPHKIRKFLPNSKYVVLMRNPSSRLVSDYNFVKYEHKNKSQEDLRNKVPFLFYSAGVVCFIYGQYLGFYGQYLKFSIWAQQIINQREIFNIVILILYGENKTTIKQQQQQYIDLNFLRQNKMFLKK